MRSFIQTPELRLRHIKAFEKRTEILGSECGCWIWCGAIDKCGYGRMVIGKHTFRAHRISFLIKNSRQPNGILLHKCHTPCCVNPAHLKEGDDAENMRDRNNANRQARGEKMGNAILNAKQVEEIRNLYASGGFLHSDLADKFGCSRPTIQGIVTRRTWTHIGGPSTNRKKRNQPSNAIN